MVMDRVAQQLPVLCSSALSARPTDGASQVLLVNCLYAVRQMIATSAALYSRPPPTHNRSLNRAQGAGFEGTGTKVTGVEGTKTKGAGVVGIKGAEGIKGAGIEGTKEAGVEGTEVEGEGKNETNETSEGGLAESPEDAQVKELSPLDLLLRKISEQVCFLSASIQ